MVGIGLGSVEVEGAVRVPTRAGACCAAGGAGGGARRRRRDSIDSNGSAPVSTANFGTACARFGMLTLEVVTTYIAPLLNYLAWKHVERS